MKRIISSALACACIFVCLSVSGCSKRTDFGDAVYSNRSYTENAAYYITTSDIYCAYFSEPGKLYHACINPLCLSHHYPECEAAPGTAVTTAMLVVKPEERVLPLIYTEGLRIPYELDEYGNREKPLPDSERRRGIITEFDTETGKSRVVAITDVVAARRMIMYHGVIYMSSIEDVAAVDVETGACTYLGEDRLFNLIGIWDGRIYLMDSIGAVYSTEPDFSDMREVYDCGVGVNAFEGNAVVDSGMLYFARNVTDAVEETYLYMKKADVYAVDLREESPSEREVAKDVLVWEPDGEDLYYTVYSYREYEKVNVGGVDVIPKSFDGGTVYMYSADTGKSEVCCSDIGASLTQIRDAVDGKILCSVWNYRDLDPDVDGNFNDGVCLLDAATGELSVISHLQYIKQYMGEQ